MISSKGEDSESVSVTLTPTSLSASGDSGDTQKQQWYEKGSFIIPATLVASLLLVGAVFHFWVLRKMRRKQMKQGGFNDKTGGSYMNDDLEYNYGLDNQDNERETDALLGGRGYGTTANSPARDGRFINSPFVDGFDNGRSPLKVNQKQGLTTRVKEFNPVAPTIDEGRSPDDGNVKDARGVFPTDNNAALANAKFLNFDMGNKTIDENGVIRNFEDILKTGMVLSLHTLKGPKPVLFTMLNGEVRWQAAKMAQKRYKLSLKDIHNVEEGKLTDNFARSTAGDESRCFSLLTAKTTLDLEASCEIDRNCLVHGFRYLIKQHNSANSSGEDAFL